MLKVSVELMVHTQDEAEHVTEVLNGLAQRLPKDAAEAISRQVKAGQVHQQIVGAISGADAPKKDTTKPAATPPTPDAPKKDATTKPPTATPKPAPAKGGKKATESAATDGAEAGEVTQDMVRAKLTELVKSGDDGFMQAQAILKKYKAKDIPSLDTGYYGNVYQDVEAELNKGAADEEAKDDENIFG